MTPNSYTNSKSVHVAGAVVCILNGYSVTIEQGLPTYLKKILRKILKSNHPILSKCSNPLWREVDFDVVMLLIKVLLK